MFAAFDQYLEQSLFRLQKESDHSSNDNEILNSLRLMLNKIFEEHNLAENPTESIRKVGSFTNLNMKLKQKNSFPQL